MSGKQYNFVTGLMGNLIIILILLIFSCSWEGEKSSVQDFSAQSQMNALTKKDSIPLRHPAFGERIGERNRLVQREIAAYAIPVRNKRVLEAIRTVPRHYFVPPSMRRSAYENRPLPIGNGQTISQPFIVAHMTELLKVNPTDTILEIGTGSGYQAAVLAELCAAVYTIEIIEDLGVRAERKLRDLGYENIHVKIGDGYEGWPEMAPFDKIIVTCSPDDIPQPLTEQLAAGGTMVIPVGDIRETQFLYTVHKDQDGTLQQKKKYAVRFVPMTGKADQD